MRKSGRMRSVNVVSSDEDGGSEYIGTDALCAAQGFVASEGGGTSFLPTSVARRLEAMLSFGCQARGNGFGMGRY